MSETALPTLYYLFPKDDDFEIKHMTDVEAAKGWEQGKK
jgi:hypothetical protein